MLGTQCGGTRWAQCRGTINLWRHNQFVGAQSICGGTINLWGHNQSVGARHAVPPQLLPSIAAICCHSMLSHALPLPSHATAAICCHPCHPMLCPQISAPKFRKPTRWWEHSGGGTIEGIMWEHNVDTLWGYNGEVQCGGTMWAQCGHNVGTMWGHNVGAQDGHNVGAQCGSNSGSTM